MRCIAWLAPVLLGGCFYVEPINQRPALDIRALSSEAVYRGDVVTLRALANDPDGHAIELSWRIHACADATVSATCDEVPLYTGTETEATFEVPAFRIDPDGEGPAVAPATRSLRVLLDARDRRGAAAKPSEQLVIPVLDRQPELRLSVGEIHGVHPYGFVVGTPVEVFARYTDGDDTAARVTLAWEVFAPAGTPPPLADLEVPSDGSAYLDTGKRLVPPVAGDWQVQVTATDPQGNATVEHASFTMVTDRAPCLARLVPEAPPAGAVLPVFDPTRFEVARVEDDLDVYPLTGDPVRQAPTFRWSLRVAAGPRTVLAGATGNSVDVDPAGYAPGTPLELRVEIWDRQLTPIPCADPEATCSIGAQPACLQRQTWHLEAR